MTRRHIRESGLFLVGRFLSLGINFAAQVLIVRYLTTIDYGALLLRNLAPYCFVSAGWPTRVVPRIGRKRVETHIYLCRPWRPSMRIRMRKIKATGGGQVAQK